MRYNPYYISARLARKILPERLAHKLLSRRSHTVERLYYGEGNHSNSRNYLQAIRETGAAEMFEGKRSLVALEAGSGLYNPLSAPLMLAGVTELILLEPYIGANFDESIFQSRFREFLRTAETDSEFPLQRTRTVEDIIPAGLGQSASIPGVTFLPQFWEATALPDSSVDLILSASVLEHLRNPHDVIRECARILRPGGYMINLIDMRDHFFRYPVEMLKYPQWAWDLLTTRAGGSGYQNRLRTSDWLQLLEAHNFTSTIIPNIELKPDELDQVVGQFESSFYTKPREDLQVLHATVVSMRSHSQLTEYAR